MQNKMMKAILVGVLAGVLGGCEAENDEASTISAAIANMWTEYETQEEAQDDGFEFEAPYQIDDYTAYVYRSMKAAINNVEEVDYKNDSDEELTLRKGECEEDEISGDYNTYDNSETVDVNGNSVTISGNDDTYSLATWTNGDYAYSVYSTIGLTKEHITGICDGIE